jgi:hypothetical protein
MELALTLVSMASFFALIVSWTVLPHADQVTKTAPTAAPQAAH